MKIASATTLCFARTVSIVLTLLAVTAMVAPAQTFTTLVNFDALNVSNPTAPLIQGTDGNFYGTTTGIEGPAGTGTVFKMTPTGTLTTLYTFCSQSLCTDGRYPYYAGLAQGTDGNFYGITAAGGDVNGDGTIFKITPDGTLTTLYTFSGTDGSSPDSTLVQGDDGNFYGTTGSGGTSSAGTIFKITPTGTLTTLHSFSGTDGSSPIALVQGDDGNFYGTTLFGGANGQGTVFEMTADGTLTTLYSFCSQGGCTDGSSNLGPLVQGTDGNFYGTTAAGGAGCGEDTCGTVFKITPTGTLTTLYSFSGSDGRSPEGALAQGSDGNFYGTTYEGGGNNAGTIFKITPAGTLTTLHSFDGTDGFGSEAGLVQGTDGKFYGTTTFGGTSSNCGGSGCGTIFSLDVGLGSGSAVTLSRTSLPFAKQVINTTSAAKNITVTNSGNAPVMFSGVTTSGDFGVSANTCTGTLAVGKKCKISVVFTPTQLGALTGTLTISDDAANSPQTVALSGTGVVPVTLTPESATYPKRTVGTTSPAKTFTLSNSQNISLDSIAIGTTGDFAVSATTCTTSLPAKGKCKISVTFTPTAIGTRTGQLSVSNNASNSPQTASLTGTGK